MLFKDLKQGQTIYAIDRKNAEYIEGRVEETPSLPHYDNRQPTMTVDVKLSLKGEQRVYSIPENLSVTYAGDLCIATDQKDLISIVKDMEKKADEAIADYPRQKEVKDKCKKLALDLDPSLKARMESEDRLNRLEEKQEKMYGLLERFLQANETKKE